MRLRHLGHSSVMLQTGDQNILVDPGNFSPGAAHVTGVTATLITHEHPDHFDTDTFESALMRSPRMKVLAPLHLARRISSSKRDVVGIERSTTIDLDHEVSVDVIPGQHAEIHREIERPQNICFIVNGVSGMRIAFTGDSLEYYGDLHRVDVMLAPIAAPWSKIGETIDFVRRTNPKRFVPLHDAILSDAGRALFKRQISAHLPAGTEFLEWETAGGARSLEVRRHLL